MKSTTQMIAIMQAFADGQEIEYKHGSSGEWVTTTEPVWGWSVTDYRIAKSTQTYYEVMNHVIDKWLILNELFTQADIDGSELVKTGREFQL